VIHATERQRSLVAVLLARPPATVGTVRAVPDSGCSWDRTIAARLRAGDELALAELYDQLGSLVRGVALRITRDEAAADDVVQDVFVSCWEHPDRYDPALGTLRSFTAMLGRRRAIDHVRRRARAARREERAASTIVSTPPDVEEAATALVIGEQVRRALELLPAEQRRAIETAYFGGCTYREVAPRLGIPEGTAKSRLRLGLARLAEVLGREGATLWT
jgi:RNA polymerase sigma-70 factor, ECF subfamily